MEGAVSTALYNGPETLDSVGVYISIHVFEIMLDDVVRQYPVHTHVAPVIIRHQFGLVRVDILFDKSLYVLSLHL